MRTYEKYKDSGIGWVGKVEEVPVQEYYESYYGRFYL